MKSPMVHKGGFVPDADRDKYTDLQVLKSAAGFYIGTMFEERDAQGNVVFTEPGTRESDYFSERDAAAIYLQALESGLALPMRETP